VAENMTERRDEQVDDTQKAEVAVEIPLHPAPANTHTEAVGSTPSDK
jgi:hypothetical protein